MKIQRYSSLNKARAAYKEYGWLSPEGKFYEMSKHFMHKDMAEKICNEFDIPLTHGRTPYRTLLELGWIRIAGTPYPDCSPIAFHFHGDLEGAKHRISQRYPDYFGLVVADYEGQSFQRHAYEGDMEGFMRWNGREQLRVGRVKRYSSLNPEFDTPEFKAWFRGSKIVDEKGSPKILYHGGTKWDVVGEGRPWTSFWATDDPFVADTYAERYSEFISEIKPVVLKIKNPLDLRDPETAKSFLGYDISGGPFNSIPKNMALNIAKESQKMVEDAKTQGFDGIIHYDTDQYNRGCHNSYVSFYPEQVRIVEDVDFGETETRFRKKSFLKKAFDVNSSQKELSQYAGRFDDMLYGMEAKDLVWKYVEDFPISKIIPFRGTEGDWIAWMEDQNAGVEEQGLTPWPEDIGEYRDIRREPIVLSLVEGKNSLWDGNHRVAAAIIGGVKTLPAIVGIPK